MISPRLAIPMHYQTAKTTLPVATVDVTDAWFFDLYHFSTHIC
jgi:hypothetical protein